MINMQKAFLVVAVISAPINAHRRRAIRQTWLNLEGNLRMDVAHFFVVGTKRLNSKVLEGLKAENAENEDMLLLPNIEDSFDNLTIKVLATFVQLHKIKNLNFVMKVDDDCFVAIDRVYNELKQTNYPASLYWGYFSSSPVFRTRQESRRF